MTVTATFNGERIATSDDACLWKGLANYWTVEVDGVRARNAAWGYRHPSPLARRVKGRIAFWGGVEVRAVAPGQVGARASTHSVG